MRIGIIVYGRLNKCVEHYNNIIEHIGTHHRVDFFLSSDNSSQSLLNDFIRLYNPVLYNNDQIIPNCDLKIYPGARPETNLHNMVCHFTNKKRGFSLLEEYMTKQCCYYDVVVCLRVDVLFQNSFNFDEILDNTIYIPEGRDYISRAINDQISYGKLEVMKKYCSIDAVDLLERNLSVPHPESLNFANLHFNKLSIKRVDLKYILDK
jgi:hypothetical protein